MDSIITKTTSLVQYVVKKVKATTCCSKGVVFILLNVLKIGKLITSAPYRFKWYRTMVYSFVKYI